jgi:hypothetical protein
MGSGLWAGGNLVTVSRILSGIRHTFPNPGIFNFVLFNKHFPIVRQAPED